MFTVARVDFIRHSLDTAIQRWWDVHELPPIDLLRDGLFVLTQGEELSDGQRSLLLRMALRYGKGVITALRYQTDLERTSVLLNDELLMAGSRWSAEDLQTWIEQDPQVDEWRELLRLELMATNRAALPSQRQKIAALLEVIEKKSVKKKNNNTKLPAQEELEFLAEALKNSSTPASRLRFVMATVLLLLLSLFFYQRYWPLLAHSDMIEVTGEFRPIVQFQPVLQMQPSSPLQPTSPLTEVGSTGDRLPENVAARPETFPEITDVLESRTVSIDRNEVTNAEYRSCVRAGKCARPQSDDSATRSGYYLKPEYDNFPVIEVDLAAANQYCKFLGKRLPAADEWETAASFAPATSRYYRFPWGDQFASQFANSAASNRGDTTATGSYRPYGSSPLGFDDMAGNVAEWTSTLVTTEGVEKAVVKGGSYIDDAVDLMADSLHILNVQTTAPWLGFRCAR